MRTPFVEAKVAVFGSSTGWRRGGQGGAAADADGAAVKVLMFYAFRDRVNGLTNRGSTRIGLV